MSFTYGKYFQKVHCKWKPFEKLKKYYPCPGCIAHSRVIGRRRAEILFRHYVKDNVPRAAHRLYWKSHPAEYQSMLSVIHRK